jgi:hypothetical protein
VLYGNELVIQVGRVDPSQHSTGRTAAHRPRPKPKAAPRVSRPAAPRRAPGFATPGAPRGARGRLRRPRNESVAASTWRPRHRRPL